MDLFRNRRPAPRLESLETRQLLSNDTIGAAATRTRFGVDGHGEAVAVIDTGVNYNHPALGGGFGAGYKVEDGVDLADGHATPLATASQHGTAVAGLIASSDATNPGVAPGADVVALRVFGDNGQGSFDRIADALQYVIDHHTQDNITVVNMSLSDGGNYTSNIYANDNGVGQRVTGLIQQLSDLNIPVVVADGNSYGGTQGIGFPAIVPTTINAAALGTDGKLGAGAQRLGVALGGASATTIGAPGTNLIAPAGGSTFQSATGSSFAAAETSGAVLILQQIYQNRFGQLPTVAQLKTWLQAGSDPVPASGIGLGSLDLAGAAAQIPTPTPVTPPAPPATTPPAQTELIVDGKSQGAIQTGDTSTPWGRFINNTSSQFNFSQVQVWTSSPTRTHAVGRLSPLIGQHPHAHLAHFHRPRVSRVA